jgi:hypothetical protein
VAVSQKALAKILREHNNGSMLLNVCVPSPNEVEIAWLLDLSNEVKEPVGKKNEMK